MVSFDKRQAGKQAEEQACRFLQENGLHLLLQNYHCRYGEIDLIMQDKDDIVFIEVRSRSRIEFGTALETIDKNKIKKLIKTATHFLQLKKWLYAVPSRFDIIAIQVIDGTIQLEWIKNAFSVDN